MPDVPRRWYGLAVAAAASLASTAVYGRLPADVATHWGVDGAPNGWSPRPVGAFAIPAVMLFIWALHRAAPALDPRRANYAKFGGAHDLVVDATLTLMLALHGAVLAIALGRSVPVERVVPAGVGALLAVLGNVLPRFRPNYFFGVRTRWTLSSDAVWAHTQRVAGHLFAAAGVVTVLGALLLPPRVVGPLLLAATLAAVVISMAYSYIAWSRDSRRGR